MNTIQSAIEIGKLRTIFLPKSIEKKQSGILLYTLSRSSGYVWSYGNISRKVNFFGLVQAEIL